MVTLGTFVNEQIKHSVLTTSGVQGAHFMAGFLEPLVQEMETNGQLSVERQHQLDDLFIGTPLGNTVVAVKIWRKDGFVLYSTTKSRVGESFVSSSVSKAARGQIVSEYDDLNNLESAEEQASGIALIEVYAPLYRTGTNEVLAVGEIYENADALTVELRNSWQTTWIVVAATTLSMLAVLYLIVRRGASTIADQRSELQQHYAEARVLARRYDELRLVADRARLDASESNEQFLGQIGSDIHDGPIQLLTLAMLKLTMNVRKLGNVGRVGASVGAEIEKAIAVTKDALGELRNISTGLSLPEITELGLDEAAHLAVSRHEDLTGEKVEYLSTSLPLEIGDAVKICVYRVIQEGLTNATKHARGARKSVTLGASDRAITVVIADSGPGVSQKETAGPARLGLAGIRNRVGGLKGNVAIHSSEGVGTCVVVSLPLEEATGSH